MRRAEKTANRKNNPLREPGWDLLMKSAKMTLRGAERGWRHVVLDPQLSTLDPQPSTLSHQTSTLNP